MWPRYGPDSMPRERRSWRRAVWTPRHGVGEQIPEPGGEHAEKDTSARSVVLQLCLLPGVLSVDRNAGSVDQPATRKNTWHADSARRWRWSTAPGAVGTRRTAKRRCARRPAGPGSGPGPPAAG